MLSQGVPMLLAGDELSHTQGGNNNAYCQDNEMSWLDWTLDDRGQRFLDFVKRATRVWTEQPVLKRRKFFQGRSIRGAGITDVSWFSPTGKEMSDQDWGAHVRCIGMRLAGDLIGEVNDRGEPIVGDTLLVLLNAHHEPIPFALPPTNPNHHWERLYATAEDPAPPTAHGAGESYPLRDRSVALFRTVPAEQPEPVVAPLRAEAGRKP
jgi:glycogen operon protein